MANPTGLDTALGDAERVFLDSSTLIAFHSGKEATHSVAKHLLGRFEAPEDPLRGYRSVVGAIELLVRPLRTGMEEFTFMHTFLTIFPNLTLLPVDLSVALQAANIRAVTSLRVPDAILVASALLAGCEAIVTNDER